jgi:uncharacterized membrane protein YkgB
MFEKILEVLAHFAIGILLGGLITIAYFGTIDFKTTDVDFIKAIDNNMTLREYFYYVDEDTYKLHYADWEQYETKEEK